MLHPDKTLKILFSEFLQDFVRRRTGKSHQHYLRDESNVKILCKNATKVLPKSRKLAKIKIL